MLLLMLLMTLDGTKGDLPKDIIPCQGVPLQFIFRSGLPIGIKLISSICIKCTKGILHGVDVCPKNYTGSSKGMARQLGEQKLWTRLLENKQLSAILHAW